MWIGLHSRPGQDGASRSSWVSLGTGGTVGRKTPDAANDNLSREQELFERAVMRELIGSEQD